MFLTASVLRRTATVAIAIWLAGSGVVAFGQPAADAPKTSATPIATLDQLAWIQGCWRGEVHGANIEEQWSAPVGNSMMGMFRVVAGGKVRMYELLALEQEAAGPVLRLKHFGPNLIGKEPIDKPLTLPLKSRKENEAVFETAAAERPIRITYTRDGDKLVVRLERQKEGKMAVDEYPFTRQESR